MVTVNVIREIFEGVVSSYKEGLAFFSQWSHVLDTGGSEHNPKVLWKQPGYQRVPLPTAGVSQNFTIDTIILDQTAQDRTPEERDQCFERMSIVAAHQLLRFRELYVDDEGSHQGVPVHLTQVGPASFTAIWDEAQQMTTGCRMTVTVSSAFQFCSSDYFNT